MTTLTTTETCDFCGNPGEQLKPVKRPHIMDPTLDGKETYRLCNIHQCTYILDGKGRCTDRVNEGEGTIDQSSKKVSQTGTNEPKREMTDSSLSTGENKEGYIDVLPRSYRYTQQG
jgi:hypothetical protein